MDGQEHYGSLQYQYGAQGLKQLTLLQLVLLALSSQMHLSNR